MKNQNPLRDHFGLKQDDIAMLFGVSRARWAMFETGRRSLPLAATQLLGEILSYFKDANAETKKQNPELDRAQQEQRQRQLKFLFDENKFRQSKLEKEITAIRRKQAAQVQLSILSSFLNNQKSKDTAENISRDHLIRIADNAVAVNHDTILIKHEIKLETLKFEQSLIESKMQNKD